MEIILRLVLLILVLSMPSLACNVSRTRQQGLVFPTETPTQSAVPSITLIEPAPATPSVTALVVVESTSSPVQPTQVFPPTATATPQPFCSVLINVRLRSGPGIDFEHLTTLYIGDLLVPFAYVPQGRTEGAWVKIHLSDNPDRIGWVIASPNIIACNVDITTLPAP